MRKEEFEWKEIIIIGRCLELKSETRRERRRSFGRFCNTCNKFINTYNKLFIVYSAILRITTISLFTTNLIHKLISRIQDSINYHYIEIISKDNKVSISPPKNPSFEYFRKAVKARVMRTETKRGRRNERRRRNALQTLGNACCNADETCRSPGTVPAYTFDSWGNYISQLPFKFARRFVHQGDEIGTVPLADLPPPSSTFRLAHSIRISPTSSNMFPLSLQGSTCRGC